MKRTAFVLGVPRSGTTALAGLLNAHPRICIGIERFKFHLRDHKRIDPSLFATERFFDLRPEDSDFMEDPDFRARYEAMREKWDDAEVVGDKIPSLFHFMEAMNRDFPQARYVYILRDIEGVASSWNAWSVKTGTDFRRAVLEWNHANRIVLDEIGKNPRRWFVVPYRELFAGDGSVLESLVRFLGLESTAELTRAHSEAVDYYVASVRPKPRRVHREQPRYIRETADMALAEAVMRHRPGTGEGALGD